MSHSISADSYCWVIRAGLLHPGQSHTCSLCALEKVNLLLDTTGHSVQLQFLLYKMSNALENCFMEFGLGLSCIYLASSGFLGSFEILAYVFCDGCLHVFAWKALYSSTEPAIIYNINI